MRILLHAWGSRGDVQPALALAVRLAASGHEPAVAAATDFGGWIAAQGVVHEPIDVDLAELSRTRDGRDWLGGGARNGVDELRLMRRVMTAAAPALARMMAHTSARYDVVVTNPVLLGAMLATPEADDGALACAMYQPAISTAQGDSYVYAPSPRRSALNQIAGVGMNLAVRPVVAPIEEAFAGTGARRLSLPGYFRRTMRVPFLLASSPLVTPPAQDWPVDVTPTGFWRLPDEDWQPDPALAEFLAAGEKPVYVGFGSMSARDPEETAALVRSAVERAGARAVVLRGVADLDVAADDRIHVIDSAPHDRLFPLMASVVHHGGAGTTAAALHAGVPQLVVPHMGDQPYWGRRVAELGVAAAPVARRGLTAQVLARGIRRSLQPAHARAARALAAQLATEDGTGAAVRRLEELFGADGDGTAARHG